MRIKDGVSLNGLKIEMRPVLKAAEKVWKSFGKDCVITAGTNATDDSGKFIHSVGSLHPYGYALDLRTNFWPARETHKMVAANMAQILGKDYDVCLHRSHIHVEYDPK